jgi:hypothetical protein
LDGSDTEDCFKKNILKSDKGDTWLEVDDKKVRYQAQSLAHIHTATDFRCSLSALGSNHIHVSIDPKGVGTKFSEKIKIPDDLTCERCTLR